jgi:hypothetical protein
MDYPLYQSGEGVGWDGTAWIWGRNYIQSILIKPSPYGLSMDMDCAVCMYICMYCMCNNGNGNTIWLLQERERERVPYCPWEACCCLCLRAVYMTSGYAHIPRCGRDIAKLGYRHIYIYVFWASSLPGDTYAWSVSWTQSNGTRLTVYRETGGEGGLYKKKSI